MLKVFANMYSSNEEDFNAVANVLKANGYEIAYQDKTTGVIIGETNDEFDDQNA